MIGADDAVSHSDLNSTTLDQLIEIVIEKAMQWLRENLPQIFAQLADFFAKLWGRLPDIAKKGLDYIWQVIEDIF